MLFLVSNGPRPTTAAAAPLASGTSLITLLQLKSKPGIELVLVEWGFSGGAYVAAAPGKVELVETDVAATVTAHVDSGVTKLTHPTGVEASAGLIALGTTATGYNASGEGSITALRQLDGPQYLPPSTAGFFKQIPLGNGPTIGAEKFARIRCHFAATVDIFCYMIFAAKGRQ